MSILYKAFSRGKTLFSSSLSSTKLLLSVLAFFWLAIIIFSITHYYLQHQSLTQQANKQVSQDAENSKTNLDNWIAYKLSIMSGFAHEVSVRLESNETMFTPQYFNQMIKMQPLTYLAIGFEDGRYISNDWDIPQGYDPRMRPWYTKTKQNLKPTITDPYLGMDDFVTQYIAFTAPVFFKGDFYGVVSGDVSYHEMAKVLRATSLSEWGEIYLTDKKGKILIAPKDMTPGQMLAELIDIPFDFSTELNQNHAFSAQQYIYSTIVFEDTDWVLVARINQQKIMQPVMNNLRYTFWITLSISLIIVFIQYILTIRFYFPFFTKYDLDRQTFLPNKSSYLEQVKQVCSKHKVQHGVLILIHVEQANNIFLTEHNRKLIQIYKSMIARLKSTINPHLIVGSLSKDKTLCFIHCHNQARVEQLYQQIQSIHLSITQQYTIDSKQYEISVKIGVAEFKVNESHTHLIEHASVALESIQLTTQYYAHFNPDTLLKHRYEAELKQAFNSALQDKELRLFFQPIVDVKNQRIACFEVLTRWFSKAYNESISPDLLFDVIESTELMQKQTTWLLNSLIEHIKHHADNNVVYAINVSGDVLLEPHYVDYMIRLFSTHHIPVQQIQIELVERVAVDLSESQFCPLSKLRQAGFTLAIDDFGTGYSSLKYINELPVSKIKIDKSFIKNIMHSTKTQALTRMILSLADELGLEVVAEGIEDAEQLELLVKQGCQLIQGYYFSKPMDSESCLQLIQQADPYLSLISEHKQLDR